MDNLKKYKDLDDNIKSDSDICKYVLETAHLCLFCTQDYNTTLKDFSEKTLV